MASLAPGVQKNVGEIFSAGERGADSAQSRPAQPPDLLNTMRFARRLAVCVLAVVAVSVLAALAWDRSDQAAAQSSQAEDTERAARP